MDTQSAERRSAVRIPLDELGFDSRAWPRFDQDEERVALFASLYAEQGSDVLPPIEVVGDENLLSDGVHRMLAARVAGLDELPAIRIEVPSGEDPVTFAYLRAVQASTKGHKELTRAERQAGIRRLIEETELTDSEIADLFGVSRQTVWRHRQLVADATSGSEPEAGERHLATQTANEAAVRLFRGIEKVFEARGLGLWDALTGDHTGERLARALEAAHGDRALEYAKRFRTWCDQAIRELGGRS